MRRIGFGFLFLFVSLSVFRADIRSEEKGPPPRGIPGSPMPVTPPADKKPPRKPDDPNNPNIEGQYSLRLYRYSCVFIPGRPKATIWGSVDVQADRRNCRVNGGIFGSIGWDL